ncbi:hypothetical protein KUTeg_003921 [Tegillarca granosa]|uniref:Calcineurin-like phosphoesterase domain-containing protein n=1 Tax=Tegillarca granosa TaxID=220873 RepID=A0ABQ9FNJ7_TEGGR|nr:hypothetical protein KUTeg_003921 [Tegillarca granosa]
MRDSSKTQVILLVADPQIQGYQDEKSFPIGSFARWDIDRYLSQTFGLAYSYCKPDVVIFLGDLMDEGSKATTLEYKYYYYRVQSIFSAAKYTKKIYVPGDNDVGGEYRDMRTEKKVDRFVKHFEELLGIVKFGFVDYIKLDLRTHDSYSEDRQQFAERHRFQVTSPVKILVGHETVSPKLKMHVYPILKLLKPQLIFSAHWHKSNLFECSDCMMNDDDHWSVHRRDISNVEGYLNINLTGKYSLTEIMVPTCSYRMGEENMGYGVAIIDSDLNMKYTVLWLPQRYLLLYMYLFVGGVVLLFNILVVICFEMGKRKRR